MKNTAAAIRVHLGEVLINLGDLAQNLKEAEEWIAEEETALYRENSALSFEAVSSAATEAAENLRAISLKCEELLSAEAGK